MKTYRVLGLMSGSSLDGLDVAYCKFAWAEGQLVSWHIHQAETLPFDEAWQEKLRRLPHADGKELLVAHAHFGHYMGELANRFLQQYSVTPDFIASHGHTIFHYPANRMTLQIGDGAALAAATGYPVINDFRAMDVALGGQGAPVAPIADRYLLPGYDFYLNLGGIANITAHLNNKYIAFDICGANQVLNALAQQIGLLYDQNGATAETGRLQETLLQQADALPYHHLPYPKSLGNDWVQEQLLPIFLHFDAPVADKLHTACFHIAGQIAQAIRAIIERERFQKEHYRLVATGGGAWNTFLMRRLYEACVRIAPVEIVIPEALTVGFKEAALIALMGLLRLENVPNCIASVTGAARDAIGGAIHQGWRRQI